MEFQLSHEPQIAADANLVVVGAGVSGTYTLRALINRLSAGVRPASPLVVQVFDRSGFWCGVPYGSRSSFNGLIITTLKEFVPPAELDAFVSWLKEKRSWWTEQGRRESGPAFDRWLDRNNPLMDRGEWDGLYIPRRLFGLYLSEVMERELAEAEAKGLLTVRRTMGEVVEIGEGRSNRFRVKFTTADGGGALECRSVVLAIGSPPTRGVGHVQGRTGDAPPVIDDVYEPGFDQNLRTLENLLSRAPADQRNILVVGTNASALEILYVLGSDPRFDGILRKVVTLSPSGRFPHRISGQDEISPPFARMQQLIAGTPTDARQVIEAAEADVADLSAEGVAVADSFSHLGALLVQVLSRLPEGEARVFNNTYGMRFSRLIRRAGREYRDTAETLAASGRLEMLAGRLESLAGDASGGGVTLRYLGTDGQARQPDTTFAAVVNCGGFEEIDGRSTVPLIRNLLSTGMARANETGRGFEVGGGLEVRDGVFVAGPLLAGVWNQKLRLWHVENVRRIESIAPLTADALAASLVGAGASAGLPAAGSS